MSSLFVCSCFQLLVEYSFPLTESDIFPLDNRPAGQWDSLACPVVVLLSFTPFAGFRRYRNPFKHSRNLTTSFTTNSVLTTIDPLQ